jgi:hypothetical protein
MVQAASSSAPDFHKGYEVFCHKDMASRTEGYYLMREWTGVTTAGKKENAGIRYRVHFDRWNGRDVKYFSNEDMVTKDFLKHDYWAPLDDFWPCFDSYGRTTCVVTNAEGHVIEIYTGLIGFQMTIAKEHKVMSGPIAAAEFERFLDKAGDVGSENQSGPPWMIFVVPEARFDEKVFQLTGLTDPVYGGLVKKVRIFVMELCLGEQRQQYVRTSVNPNRNSDRPERDQSPEKRMAAAETEQ